MSGNKTGETWVRLESIAHYFGKSKRSISQSVKELEDVKPIERMQMEMVEISKLR